jgi:acyl carrier protein
VSHPPSRPVDRATPTRRELVGCTGCYVLEEVRVRRATDRRRREVRALFETRQTHQTGEVIMSDPTLTGVKRIIAAHKSISVELVEDDARLREDLDIDSLGATEIIFEIEDQFQIVIGEHVARDFQTVRDVATGVDALLATR